MNSAWPHIVDYLNHDPLRHLVHLKYIHLYREQLAAYTIEAGDEMGVLLHHPVAMTFWDTQAYPNAQQVLLPTATTQPMAEALAAYAHHHFDPPLVIKCCDELTHEAFAARFTLTPARTLISYTTQHAPTPPHGVQLLRTATPPIVELFQQNGYSPAEIGHYFDDGALAFAIFDGPKALAACMAFRNFGQVWEIAGVHTIAAARRRGYGRQVVQAALAEILRQGLIPRYQVEFTNTASITLAESLGMRVCLRFEHFVAVNRW